MSVSAPCLVQMAWVGGWHKLLTGIVSDALLAVHVPPQPMPSGQGILQDRHPIRCISVLWKLSELQLVASSDGNLVLKCSVPEPPDVHRRKLVDPCKHI